MNDRQKFVAELESVVADAAATEREKLFAAVLLDMYERVGNLRKNDEDLLQKLNAIPKVATFS